MTPLQKHHKAYSTGELSVFIISAFHADQSTGANLRDTKQLQLELEQAFGPTFIKRVLGSYKGAEEQSFVVNGDRRKVLDIAAHFGQESVLHLDTNRQATLYFINQGPGTETYEKLGRLVTCTEEEAKAGDAWTYDRKQGQYYHVV